MPILKVFDKTITQINEWQENCAKLQHGLRVLLGENVSIADVAVAKTGFEKKKKAITEAELAGNVLDKDRSGKDVIVTPSGKTKKLTSQQSKEMQRNDNDENTIKNEAEEKRTTITRIRKTEDILKSDQKLRDIIIKYFESRINGNFGRAKEMKSFIMEYIQNRDLDYETVFASYDLGLGIGSEDEDEDDDKNNKDDTEDENINDTKNNLGNNSDKNLENEK